MKTVLYTFLTFATLTLSSCGTDILSPNRLDNPENINAIKTTVEEKLGGDMMVYNLKVSADDHLSSNFGMASVKYMRKGTSYSQYYLKVTQTLSDPEKSSYQKNLHEGGKKISEFDFEQIPENFNKAVELIKAESDEFEDFVLYSWEFVVDENNEVASSFTIEGSKIGEGTSRQGNNIVTNYYEFEFDFDKEGNLVLDL